MQLLLTLWLWLFYFFAVEKKNSSKCLLPYLEIEQKVRSIKIEKRMKHLFLKKQSNPDFCGLWWNLSLTLTAIFSYTNCVFTVIYHCLIINKNLVDLYTYCKKSRCNCKWYEGKLHLRYLEIIKYFCFSTYDGVITLTLCGNSKKRATMYLCKKMLEKAVQKGNSLLHFSAKKKNAKLT